MTDPTPFATALHERLREEHPDLDELIRVSTVAGTRIRRTRRAGAACAAAAGVAVVAVGVAALQGSDVTTSDRTPIANRPTAAGPSEAAGAEESITLAELARELERLANLSSHDAETLSDSPVQVTADGWDCDRPADEKFMCRKQGAFVVVNWRDAASRDDYLDPGKADALDGVHTFVSDVHGAWFATVAPAKGTTQAEVDEVGAGLVWVE